jgi:hypothetical protein
MPVSERVCWGESEIQKYKNTKQGQQQTQTKNYSRYKTEKKESKKIGLSYFNFF